jgi:polysaccharide biosynthesis protein PelA
MRFDHAETIEIDIAASAGVIGYNRHAGSLYVALDAAVPDAVIAIRSPDAKRQVTAQQRTTPHLIESRWQVAKVKRQTCAVTAEAQGFGAGDMSWGGLPAGKYIVSAARGGFALASQQVVADASGRTTARLDISAIEPVQLTISCAP